MAKILNVYNVKTSTMYYNTGILDLFNECRNNVLFEFNTHCIRTGENKVYTSTVHDGVTKYSHSY